MNPLSDELLPIATFVRPAEAVAARVALEAQGIRCFLKDEHIISMDWLLGNAVGYVKLVVPASDAQRARELLDTQFDDWPSFTQGQTWKHTQCGEDETQRRADRPYAPPQSEAGDVEIAGDNVAADTGEAVEGRACCPACGRARVAVCPFCQTTGTQFRAADMIVADLAAGEPALLICPTCDEPFEPSYLRRCEWCGHDFGAGLEPPEIVRPMQTGPLNARVLLAVAGAVGIVAAIVVYFAVLLS